MEVAVAILSLAESSSLVPIGLLGELSAIMPMMPPEPDLFLRFDSLRLSSTDFFFINRKIFYCADSTFLKSKKKHMNRPRRPIIPIAFV